MRILALELSSEQGSVAWIENGRSLFVRSFANNRKHSGLFFENLRNCLEGRESPNCIVVGLGPGSYAGVRIAIATATGLRAAITGKLVGIPSICAIETNERDYCVIGDARRESFFWGRVSDGRLIEGPSLHTNVDLERQTQESNLPVYVSGSLPQFPMAIMAYPSAQRLAELVRDRISEMSDSRSLEPIYLREPHITVPRSPLRVAIKR